MPPMTRSGPFSHFMYPGLHKVYDLTVKSYPTEWTQILNVETSTKRQEEDSAWVGFGLVPEKEEGHPALFDAMDAYAKLEYLHKTFAMGYEITEEAFEDELYGVFARASKALGIAVNQTEDVLGQAVLNNSFTGSPYVGLDGLALCHVAHTQKKSAGTNANRPATDADFDPVTLAAALQTWEEWEDDNGLPMLSRPKYVVSGPAQRKIIGQTLGSEKEPFTSDNQPNAIKEWNLERIILHYLVDPDAWWILSVKDQHFLKWFWRVKPAFRNFDDPLTGNARFMVRFRQSCGFTHWHGVYGSSGV